MLKLKRDQAPAFGDHHFTDDQDIEVQRPQSIARSNFWAEARLLLRDLIFVLMGAVLMVVFIIQPVKVEGTSMLPRLHDGERIFVNKLVYYHLPQLSRGDIVVFWYPNDPSKSYIKRLIGLPGETVEVREGRILVNGRALNEEYLDPQRNSRSRTQPPVFVKPHYYFVMGDNRDDSWDSRAWGLVPEKYIYGKALVRYWPLGNISIISHDPDYGPIPPGAPAEGPGNDGTDDDEN